MFKILVMSYILRFGLMTLYFRIRKIMFQWWTWKQKWVEMSLLCIYKYCILFVQKSSFYIVLPHAILQMNRGSQSKICCVNYIQMNPKSVATKNIIIRPSGIVFSFSNFFFLNICKHISTAVYVRWSKDCYSGKLCLQIGEKKLKDTLLHKYQPRLHRY